MFSVIEWCSHKSRSTWGEWTAPALEVTHQPARFDINSREITYATITSLFECAVNLGPFLLFANSTPVAWTASPTFLVIILMTVACKTTLRLGLAKTSSVRYADSDDTLMRFSSMYVTRKSIQTLVALFGCDLLIYRAISEFFHKKIYTTCLLCLRLVFRKVYWNRRCMEFQPWCRLW